MLELRSGFPWSAVDEFQDFVGPRNRAGRLPAVRTLDFTLARPWRFRKYRFRAGLKLYNVFGASADRDVQNNVTVARLRHVLQPDRALDRIRVRVGEVTSGDGLERANRPTPAASPTTSASGAPARLSSTPMLVSERSWPGGSSAAQKNSPTLKPIAAVKPTTISSRQPTRCGRCRPAASATPAADQDAERLADDDRDRQSPGARLERVKGHAGVDEPEEEQRDLGRISPPDLELAQRILRRRDARRRRIPDRAPRAAGTA